MKNHPQQRKINTLDKGEYLHVLNCNIKSLELEFRTYRERNDLESCAEIRQEYRAVIQEILMFKRAQKRSDKYHGVK